MKEKKNKEKFMEPMDILKILAVVFIIAVIIIIAVNKVIEMKSSIVDEDVPYFIDEIHMGGKPSTGNKHKDEETNPEESDPIKTVEYENNINGIKFNIVNNEFSGDMKKEERGFYIDSLNQPNSPYYIYITAGERRTGGYSLSVKDIEIDNDKTLRFIIEESKPEADQMVTMALTYPTLCIEMEEYPYTIEVVDIDGNAYEYKI